MASGHPECPLRWTSKSVRNLRAALQKLGHSIGVRTVHNTLLELGYRLQGNRREVEGVSHPDRDAQFRYISKCVTGFQRRGQPVISIDCKKKELIGNFKNGGKEWRPEGMPERVKVHDFEIAENGKAIPYGVYDLTRNAGWVSVGIDHETSSFAVQSIRRWWKAMGKPVYPKAKSLLVTADGGGSNCPKRNLWRWELQKLADETGLSISVVHFPPGTSKWNKIEHRLFSYISANWRGRPLTNLAVIINLIAATRTRTGLRVRAELDTGKYPLGVEVAEEDLATIRLRKHRVHGEWNYTISVGVDHETSSFAVQSIRRWWKAMGKPVYPKAKSLLITADGGGSNSPRRALRRWELQKFADEAGLSISVVHFPPGTSKWNKIEHRLFSYISANWRGRPLTSLAVIINLIAATRTRTGLRVRAELDTGKYPTGVEVSEEDLATIRLRKHRVHGEWNYTIRPRSKA